MYAIAVGVEMVSTKLYLFFNFPAIICFWSSDQSNLNLNYFKVQQVSRT